MYHRITRTTQSLDQTTRVLIDTLIDLLNRACEAHWQLLEDNPAYAAAVAAGITGLLSYQDRPLDLIAAILAALLGLYAAA